METPREWIDAGAWVGRRQTFAVIASKCSAAQALSLEIVLENQKDTVFFNLGPHPPRLWPEDLDLVHRLWLELSAKGPGSKLHHRDIVGVALRRMNAELHSDLSREVMDDVLREVSDGSHHEPPPE